MRIPVPKHIELRVRKLLVWLCMGCVLCIGVGAILWRIGAFGALMYLDIPLHLFGGFVAATALIVALYAIHDSDGVDGAPFVLKFVAALGFVALVSIAWEIFEFFTDTYMGTCLQVSVIETLKDMLVALAGGVMPACVLCRKAEQPFMRLVGCVSGDEDMSQRKGFENGAGD
jgi:hypothetical protein